MLFPPALSARLQSWRELPPTRSLSSETVFSSQYPCCSGVCERPPAASSGRPPLQGGHYILPLAGGRGSLTHAARLFPGELEITLDAAAGPRSGQSAVRRTEVVNYSVDDDLNRISFFVF